MILLKEYCVTYLLGDKTKKRITYEANTKAEAKRKANEDGFTVVGISENISYRINKLGERYIPSIGKLRPKLIIDFFSQLAFMLDAEIRMIRAVRNIYRGTKNPQLRKFLNRLINDMEQGNQLSYSLVPEYGFTPEIKLQVEAGERSGNIVDALRTIVQRMEMDLETRSKVLKQLYYPAIVILVMVFVINYILTNVVPSLAQILIENGAELPTATVLLINISDFVKQYGAALLFFIFAVFFILFVLKRHKIFGIYIDKAILSIPFIGKVILLLNISKYFYIVGHMLHGQLFLITSLKIAAESVGNKYIRKRMLSIPIEMEKNGKQLDDLMRDIYLTNEYSEFISTGLATGKLSEIFEKISQTTLDDANNRVKVLLTMIEPIITIIMGACVALIVMALFMPMFSLIDAI